MKIRSRLMKNDAGFTMLETLVSLILVSVMGLLITQSIAQWRLLRDREQVLTHRMEMEAVGDRVAELLQGMMPLRLIAIGNDQSVFIGTDNEVRFVAQVRTGALSQGLREIVLTKVALSKVVQLEWRSFLRRPVRSVSGQVPVATVLMKNLSEVRFRYLEVGNDGSQWVASWSSNGVVPRAIELTLSSDFGGRMTSVVRIVKLAIGN